MKDRQNGHARWASRIGMQDRQENQAGRAGYIEDKKFQRNVLSSGGTGSGAKSVFTKNDLFFYLNF